MERRTLLALSLEVGDKGPLQERVCATLCRAYIRACSMMSLLELQETHVHGAATFTYEASSLGRSMLPWPATASTEETILDESFVLTLCIPRNCAGLVWNLH